MQKHMVCSSLCCVAVQPAPVSSHCAQGAAETIWREVNSLKTCTGIQAASPWGVLGTSLVCGMRPGHHIQKEGWHCQDTPGWLRSKTYPSNPSSKARPVMCSFTCGDSERPEEVTVEGRSKAALEGLQARQQPTIQLVVTCNQNPSRE